MANPAAGSLHMYAYGLVNSRVNGYTKVMAENVNPDELKRMPRGRRPKYPWAQWTDGEWWHAKQGEDFTVAVNSFRSTLANHACKYGLRVVTQQTETGMAFQFTQRKG